MAPARLNHQAFDVLVLLKGLNGILEISGGLILIFVKPATISALISLLLRQELSEDPGDWIANGLAHWAETFGRDTELLTAAYLTLHGALKIALATLLLMGKSWAYPTSLLFFSAIVAYLVLRLANDWNWLLAALALVDSVTICVIFREWRMKKIIGQPQS